MINASNFEPINLKLDKKTWEDIDIYFIGYIDKNKPEDWRVKSVNPLYLMINNVFCLIKEENGITYLEIKKSHCDPVLNKWNDVFDSIKNNIQKIRNEKVNFNDGFNKIKFISNDSLRIIDDRLTYFPH